MAAGHYTFFHNVPSLFGFPEGFFAEGEKFILATALAAILIAIGAKATSLIRRSKDLTPLVVPPRRLTLFNFFDVMVESFAKFQDSLLGPENRHYLPFTGSVFLFILFSNLLGLVPGFPAITTTVWINVGMAVVVFVYFNLQGVKANGLFGYLKHFGAGTPLWIAWMVFPIEIISTLLRILTLNLRLYWNISADHMVLGTFTEMVPFLLPVVFYAFGTFVCFMQAFVFTTLTMVYILLATQHEEH